MTAVFSARRARVPLAAFLICISLIMAGGNAAAQNIQVSPNTLAFSVPEWGTESQQVTVTNNSGETVLLELSFPYYYGSEFFVLYSGIPLESGASVPIDVYFTDKDGAPSNSATLQIRAKGTSFDDAVYVSLTATVSINCSGTAATASGGGTITKGGVALLKGSGGASCSWAPTTDLTEPLSCATLAAPAVTTTYTLTVTSSSGFCSASDDVTVNVVDLSSLPNGSTLPSGSILLLMRSTPAPDGYSYLGTSTISYGNGKSKTTIQVDVYSKD